MWPDERSLGERLLALGAQLRQHFTAAAAEVGLTFQEGRALRLVGTDVDPRRLAGLLGCDAPRLAVLLRSLEAHGYVVRGVSRSDRRVREVVLTPAGVRAARSLVGRLEQTSPLMTRLDRPEREQLAVLLDRLLAPGGPPTGG